MIENIKTNKLNGNEFSIKIINVLYRIKTRPTYKESSRNTDGLIYYVKGGHNFYFEKTKINTKENNIAYLPLESSYNSRLISKNTEYYEIDFEIYENGKKVKYSDNPFVLSEEDSYNQLFLIRKLYDNYSSLSKNVITCNGILMQILGNVKYHEQILVVPSSIDKIKNTVSFLEKHYNENTSMEELAKISYTCVSNLEKLFKKAFNCSPVVYRNKLRIIKAKSMLESGFSIVETAVKTGFNDVYYFNRYFKKITGETPGNYIKKNDKI